MCINMYSTSRTPLFTGIALLIGVVSAETEIAGKVSEIKEWIQRLVSLPQELLRTRTDCVMNSGGGGNHTCCAQATDDCSLSKVLLEQRGSGQAKTEEFTSSVPFRNNQCPYLRLQTDPGGGLALVEVGTEVLGVKQFPFWRIEATVLEYAVDEDKSVYFCPFWEDCEPVIADRKTHKMSGIEILSIGIADCSGIYRLEFKEKIGGGKTTVIDMGLASRLGYDFSLVSKARYGSGCRRMQMSWPSYPQISKMARDPNKTGEKVDLRRVRTEFVVLGARNLNVLFPILASKEMSFPDLGCLPYFSATWPDPGTFSSCAMAVFPGSGSKWILSMMEIATGIAIDSEVSARQCVFPYRTNFTQETLKRVFFHFVRSFGEFDVLVRRQHHPSHYFKSLSGIPDSWRLNHPVFFGGRSVILIRNPFDAIIAWWNTELSGPTGPGMEKNRLRETMETEEFCRWELMISAEFCGQKLKLA